MKLPSEYPKAERIKEHSFATVIHAYLASPKFASLAPSSQAGLRLYLMVAAHPDVLGKKQAGEMRPALVQHFLDSYADRPGAQLRARGAIKSVEKWALVRDFLPWPITTGVEVIGGGDGHRPWNETQVAVAEAHCRPEVARAVTLASNTGQRGSDLIRMRWSDIEEVDGHPGINVKQKKTGLQIWIPFTQALITAISGWERRPAPLLLKPNGEPWGNRKQLSMAWERQRDTQPMLAPCHGLVLHGLRATACVRLRRAGAKPTQIADMVGLSVPMVERYCRYADQRTNAIAAVHYLERDQNKNRVKSRPSGGLTS